MDTVFTVLYFGLLGGLSLHGLHAFWLIYHRLRTRKKMDPPPASVSDLDLPLITVQLPLFNERTVVDRLLRAIVSLQYPKDRLQIQVLDDSTDETLEISKALCDRYRKEGSWIDWIHRTDRRDFKAGALANGLATAKGELIAIFDADFAPDPDFLLRVAPAFDSPRVGMVQMRWGHLNENESVLTRLQALFLDGHFVMESETRDRAGLFLTFNGTAGVWRRQCIEDSGGWRGDTLTEDLDLSYRAQLAGWRFRYLNGSSAPAELPNRVESFKAQQKRWTRGQVDTLLKLGGQIGVAAIPLRQKIEAFFHLTSHLVFPGLVLLSVCAYPALAIRLESGWWKLFFIDFPLYVLGIFSVNLFYIWGQCSLYTDPLPRIARIPGLLFLGTGLAVSNSFAVWEGYRKKPRPFDRTPKTGGIGASPYRSMKSGTTGVEIGLAIYLLFCMVHAVRQELWASLPFLAVFAFGFGSAAILSLGERLEEAGVRIGFSRARDRDSRVRIWGEERVGLK